MNFKKILIIVILVLGVYFIFINPAGKNIIDTSSKKNDNNRYDSWYQKGHLTKKYFDWAKNSLKISDPKITPNLLDKFFNEVEVPQLILPTVSDSEIIITISNKENLKNYLEQTAKIKILPEDINMDYNNLAQELTKDSGLKLLEKVLSSIDLAITSLKNVPVPPEAKDIHKKYLGLIKYMRVMFNDLYNAKEDPVKINYNQKLSQNVIALSNEIIKQREQLANTLK
jgi:hypothetical protein